MHTITGHAHGNWACTVSRRPNPSGRVATEGTERLTERRKHGDDWPISTKHCPRLDWSPKPGFATVGASFTDRQTDGQWGGMGAPVPQMEGLRQKETVK